MPAASDASVSSSTSVFYDFRGSFASLLSEERLAEISQEMRPRGGGSPKLSLWQWIMARVYHEFARIGSFSASVREVTRVRISDSALSQRASSIGWELIERILPEVLRPLAEEELHPEAFHRGYRLLAIDGYRFNLRNTPGISEEAIKIPCSKGGGEPAFAQMLGVALVEVGLHQPLGAAFGWQGEGELTLARRVFSGHPLPERSLVLGDRLFGTPSLFWEQAEMLKHTGGALLMRVRSNLVAKQADPLGDGSWLVDIKVRDPDTGKTLGTMRLREIRAEITYEGGNEPLAVRFWTTLLDERIHPAGELVELYAKRWEEELFFRELKSHLHGRSNLLDAQTPATAAQEAFAMLLAATLVARQRKEVARRAGVDVLRISFAKVHQKASAMCELLSVGEDLIPPPVLAALTERLLEDLEQSALIPERRPRSCQRGLRQPVKNWPKTRTPTSKPLVKRIKITNP